MIRTLTTPVALERMVVARFLNGTLVKGTTHNFSVQRPMFNVYVDGDETTRAMAVAMETLKAVFFVKTFEGNRFHMDSHGFGRVKGHGRRLNVTFRDGESLSGFTMGYNSSKPGFFMVPTDPDSNNSRIFVVNAAIHKLEWVTD